MQQWLSAVAIMAKIVRDLFFIVQAENCEFLGQCLASHLTFKVKTEFWHLPEKFSDLAIFL